MKSRLNQYNLSTELHQARAAGFVCFWIYKEVSKRGRFGATPCGSIECSQFAFEYKQTEALYSNLSQLVIPPKSTPWTIPLRTNKTYCIISVEVHFTTTVEIQVMKWNEMVLDYNVGKHMEKEMDVKDLLDRYENDVDIFYSQIDNDLV